MLTNKEIISDFNKFRITHRWPMIVSGTEPNKDWEIDQFGAVLNVHDAPGLSLTPYPNQPRLWLPIMETADWNLGQIVAAIRALEQWHSEGRYILVHCAAGANRSPTIINLWRLYRGEVLSQRDMNYINYNMETGTIPKTLGNLFRVMAEHPTWCAQACVSKAGFQKEALSEKRRKRNKIYKRWGWFIKLKNKMFPPDPIRL